MATLTVRLSVTTVITRTIRTLARPMVITDRAGSSEVSSSARARGITVAGTDADRGMAMATADGTVVLDTATVDAQ
jgi:hypothetical protein